MVGVAYVVGALTNVYYAKHESVLARVVDDHVWMDPGADRTGKLVLVTPDAPAEVKDRAVRFVAYQEWSATEGTALEYVMWTPNLEIRRGDFNALVEVLIDAMDAKGLPFARQRELLALLAPMHRDIVNNR